MSETNKMPEEKNADAILNKSEQGHPVEGTLYENSQSLVDIANNTFKELCKTLENEQTKLIELEERRKKLQDEMLRLKMEIEEEKNSYRMNLTETTSISESANEICNSDTCETDEEVLDMETEAMPKALVVASSKLGTCYEDDENSDDLDETIVMAEEYNN